MDVPIFGAILHPTARWITPSWLTSMCETMAMCQPKRGRTPSSTLQRTGRIRAGNRGRGDAREKAERRSRLGNAGVAVRDPRHDTTLNQAVGSPFPGILDPNFGHGRLRRGMDAGPQSSGSARDLLDEPPRSAALAATRAAQCSFVDRDAQQAREPTTPGSRLLRLAVKAGSGHPTSPSSLTRAASRFASSGADASG